ncbi:alpha-tocopherol transfer protein-like [Bradysia coprophila]|uniref:alpha-tocopherol transfer protein-like n=1 Tax=Bradysia coprophila TaxID=38358 RepID=UPI00187DC392|nr:alpha-tocopherol transfer protein-like [Bradysia coprophila]
MALQLVSCDKQYEKFPQLIRSEVLKLQDWYNRQPHTPSITELEAMRFLHACYYSVEQAKICLDTYHTARTHWPEFFKNRNVHGTDVTSQMKIASFTLLPELTAEGYGVILCRLIDSEVLKFNFWNSVKLFGMVTDVWFAQNDLRQGYVCVIDMKGCTLMHLTRVNVIALKKFMFYIQEALPIRLKAIHFINTVSFMDKVLALMKPFTKKELMNMLQLHATMDTFLDKCVPKSAMPNEYGGSAGDAEKMRENSYTSMQANARFFEEEETTKRVNEKLRQGKPHGDGDIFGLDGSFKQLSFD